MTRRRKVTSDADDVRGAGNVLAIDLSGRISANIDAVCRETGNNGSGNLDLRLDAHRLTAQRQPARPRETIQILGRDETLGRAV